MQALDLGRHCGPMFDLQGNLLFSFYNTGLLLLYVYILLLSLKCLFGYILHKPS